jgi:hypothetical protein
MGEGHTAERQEKWPSLNVELDRFTFHPTGNRAFNFPDADFSLGIFPVGP